MGVVVVVVVVVVDVVVVVVVAVVLLVVVVVGVAAAVVFMYSWGREAGSIGPANHNALSNIFYAPSVEPVFIFDLLLNVIVEAATLCNSVSAAEHSRTDDPGSRMCAKQPTWF